MEKKLNTTLINDKMLGLGLSQTDLAEQLGVTKAAISSWLKPEKFPRPRHLLKLAEMLNLDYSEIVLKPALSQPAVAFRKSGNYKIQETHREQFFHVSRLLNRLVPYLPFDSLSAPAILKEPLLDYDYIQRAAKAVRDEIGKDIIEIEDFVGLFYRLQAVLIPVLWGEKHYKNGTHVFLPDTQSTWIFINLDTKILDFKFWLAHELAHAKAPQLLEQDGESFADQFAGALLFPSELAAIAYEDLTQKTKKSAKIAHIQKLAEKYTISPITIYKEIQSYARWTSKDVFDLESDSLIYKSTTEFNKKHKLLSQILFTNERPEPKEYIQVAKAKFKTCFFDCLSKYLKTHEDEPAKFIASILDIPLADAFSLKQEL